MMSLSKEFKKLTISTSVHARRFLKPGRSTRRIDLLQDVAQTKEEVDYLGIKRHVNPEELLVEVPERIWVDLRKFDLLRVQTLKDYTILEIAERVGSYDAHWLCDCVQKLISRVDPGTLPYHCLNHVGTVWALNAVVGFLGDIYTPILRILCTQLIRFDDERHEYFLDFGSIYRAYPTLTFGAALYWLRYLDLPLRNFDRYFPEWCQALVNPAYFFQLNENFGRNSKNRSVARAAEVFTGPGVLRPIGGQAAEYSDAEIAAKLSTRSSYRAPKWRRLRRTMFHQQKYDRRTGAVQQMFEHEDEYDFDILDFYDDPPRWWETEFASLDFDQQEGSEADRYVGRDYWHERMNLFIDEEDEREVVHWYTDDNNNAVRITAYDHFQLTHTTLRTMRSIRIPPVGVFEHADFNYAVVNWEHNFHHFYDRVLMGLHENFLSHMVPGPWRAFCQIWFANAPISFSLSPRPLFSQMILDFYRGPETVAQLAARLDRDPHFTDDTYFCWLARDFIQLFEDVDPINHATSFVARTLRVIPPDQDQVLYTCFHFLGSIHPSERWSVFPRQFPLSVHNRHLLFEFYAKAENLRQQMLQPGEVQDLVNAIKPVPLFDAIMRIVRARSLIDVIHGITAIVQIYSIKLTPSLVNQLSEFVTRRLSALRTLFDVFRGVEQQGLSEFLERISRAGHGQKLDTPLFAGVIALAVTVVVLITAGSTTLLSADITSPRFYQSLSWITSAAERVPKNLYGVYELVQKAVCWLLDAEDDAPEKKAVRELHERCTALLIRQDNYISAVREKATIMLTEPQLYTELVSLYDDVRAASLHINTKTEGVTMVKFTLTEIEKKQTIIRDLVHKVRSVQNTKVEPVVIWFYGLSGVGKSSLIGMLHTAVANSDPALVPLYTRNCVDKFWSKYEGQKVIVYDDFGATHEGEDQADLVSMKSHNPMPLSMPDVESKGMFFNGEVVLIASNHLYFNGNNVKSNLSNPTILHRRRDLCVHVSPRGTGLDFADSAYRWPSNHTPSPDDYDLFTVSPYPRQGDFSVDRAVAQPISFDQLVNFILDRRRAFITEHIERISRIEAALHTLPNAAILTAPKLHDVFQQAGDDAETVSESVASDAIELVTYGKGSIYLLIGPPGTGKSHLVRTSFADAIFYTSMNYQELSVGNTSKVAILNDISVDPNYLSWAVNIVLAHYDNPLFERVIITANPDLITRLGDVDRDRFLRRIKYTAESYFHRKPGILHWQRFTARDVETNVLPIAETVGYKVRSNSDVPPRRMSPPGVSALLHERLEPVVSVLHHRRALRVNPVRYEDILNINATLVSIAAKPPGTVTLSYVNSILEDKVTALRYMDSLLVLARAVQHLFDQFSTTDDIVAAINNSGALRDFRHNIAIRFLDVTLGVFTLHGETIIVDVTHQVRVEVSEEGFATYIGDQKVSTVRSADLVVELDNKMEPPVPPIPERFKESPFAVLLTYLGDFLALGFTFGSMYNTFNLPTPYKQEGWAEDVDSEIPLGNYTLPKQTRSLHHRSRRAEYSPEVTARRKEVPVRYEREASPEEESKNYGDKNETRTKHNVRRTALKKPAMFKAKQQASIDPGARSVGEVVQKNIVQIVTQRGVPVVKAVMVSSHYGVTVAHVFQKVSADTELFIVDLRGGTEAKYRIYDASIIEGKDVGVFFVEEGPAWPDIRVHLPTGKKQVDISGQFGTLILKLPTNQTLWQTVKFKNVTTVFDGEALQYGVVANKASGYSVNAPVQTQAGDCGSPLIVLDTRAVKKWIGIHAAASTHEAFTPMLLREEIDEAIESLDSSTEPVQQSVSFAKLAEHTMRDLVDGEPKVACGFPIIGVAQVNGKDFIAPVSAKTGFYPSPLVHPEWGRTHEPSLKVDSDIRKPPSDLTILETYVAAFKPDPRAEVLSEAFVDECALEIGDYLGSVIRRRGIEIRRLTKTAALNRDTHIPTSNPMNTATAPGYPWCMHFQSKRDVIDMDENGMLSFADTEMGRRVQYAIDRYVDNARRGVATFTAFKVSLKDELRPLRKIYDVVGTRGIACAPIDYCVVTRMYLHGATAALAAVRDEIPFQVGIDAKSLDWESNIQRHLRKGINGFDGDYRRWDALALVEVCKKVHIIYNRIYDIAGVNNRPEDNFIRTILDQPLERPVFALGDGAISPTGGAYWECSCGRQVEVESADDDCEVEEEPVFCPDCNKRMPMIFVQLDSGVVSGSGDTTIRNCMINFMYYLIIWKRLALARGYKHLANLQGFLSKCALSLYGDDNICTADDQTLKWFNFLTFQAEAAKLGLSVTTASKDNEAPPFRRITELEFLKRRIVYDTELNAHVGPLVQESMSKMLCYYNGAPKYDFGAVAAKIIPQPKCTDNFAIEATVNSFLEEAVLWGREFYDFALKHCDRVSFEHDFTYTRWSFEAQRERVVFRSKEYGD